MSHFAVLVIGPNYVDQLAPFQENNCGTCPEEYLAFDDREAEKTEEYEKGSTQYVVMPDGTFALPWEERFKVRSEGSSFDHTEIPDNLERRDIPFNKTYPTLEAYAKDWCGMERDPEVGRFGFWSNPNAKWDWHEVGGRFADRLALADGEFGDCATVGELVDTDLKVFAVVKDGEWYERGGMGWFAWVRNEKDEDVWCAELKTLLEGLPPETMLTIVDCHI